METNFDNAGAPGTDPLQFTKADIAALISEDSHRVVLSRRQFVNKNRHNIADAWKVFDIIEVDGYKMDFVSCSQCGTLYQYKVAQGTTTLSGHLRSCIGSKMGVSRPLARSAETELKPNPPMKVTRQADTVRQSQSIRQKAMTTREQMEALESSLDKFKAEMTMKMAIVEQILNNRIDQFEIHKDLLRKEESLLQTLMNHWKEIAKLTESGVSLAFSEVVTNADAAAAAPDPEDIESDSDSTETATSISRKRKSSSNARRERAKRLLTVIKQEMENDSLTIRDKESAAEVTENEDGKSTPASPDIDQEPNTEPTEGMEKKVYFNVYSPPYRGFQNGARYSKPIWKHYLEEENGASALCKHCDSSGKQTIIKIHTGHHSSLMTHLRTRHLSAFQELQDEPPVDAKRMKRPQVVE